MEVTFRRTDGSFVAQVNGYPYHITASDPLYEAALEFGADAPFEPAPPPPVPTLSREAFCVALIEAGILTEAEAVDAALGAWPPKFEPALQGKPLVEQLTIKNLWRETKTVARDAALFLDLLAFYAGAMKLTDAQAEALGDAIFAGAA